MADTEPQTTERFTSQALDDAERGSAIVKVITKRIRAASKRLKKIEVTEAKAQGQPENINQDQVHAVCGCPARCPIQSTLHALLFSSRIYASSAVPHG